MLAYGACGRVYCMDHLGGDSCVQGVSMLKKISMFFVFALMGMVVYLPKIVWAVPSSIEQEVFVHVFLTTLFSVAYFSSNKQKGN